MRGKGPARKALGRSPLKNAGRANAARFEGMPGVFANAHPTAIGHGRPITLWATDTRFFIFALIAV